MADVLNILTSFVIIIIVGLLASIISKRLKIANVLLLILSGLVLGYFAKSLSVLEIPADTMLLIAILALATIIFDGTSRFQIRVLQNFSGTALKLMGFFLLVNMLVFGFVISIFFLGAFNLASVFYGFVFAVLAAGTDPASMFAMLKNKANKTVELLQVEAILNTPITVLFPFIIIDIIQQVNQGGILNWQSYFSGIMMQILVGIGAGIFVGIVFFKAMKKFYDEDISPLSIIAASILSYILAENLAGNGVLAVAVLGFVFGNIYVKNKEVLQDFNSMVSNSLEIIVFILIGFIVNFDLDIMFVAKSLLLFILLLACRYIAINLSLGNEDYTRKQKVFMTLVMPKGISVAVMVFSLAVMKLVELDIIANLVVVTMIYSIILSAIVSKFEEKFTGAGAGSKS